MCIWYLENLIITSHSSSYFQGLELDRFMMDFWPDAVNVAAVVSVVFFVVPIKEGWFVHQYEGFVIIICVKLCQNLRLYNPGCVNIILLILNEDQG